MALPTGTIYPGAFDGIANGYGAVSGGDTIAASYANNQTSATLSIEHLIGVDPLSGTPYATIGAALAGKSDIDTIQTGALITGPDSGVANAYAVTLSPTPPAYTAGQMVVFVAANGNTGASTLSVNGATAQALVLNGGTPLTGGEISAGQAVTALYDGIQFQLVGSVPGNAAITQPNTVNELRLTLVSGTPIAPDYEASGSTTIYFTPYTGGRIALYDTSTSTWQVWTTTELSLDITGYDTTYPWDMFLYNDSGTLTLSALEWSGNDTRATDIVLQDGVYVQSGAPNYRWVGSFALNPSDGTCNDNPYMRMLFNAQNRVPHTVSTWTDTASTNVNFFYSLISSSVLVGIVAESFMLWGTALGQGDGVSASVEIGIGIATPSSAGYPAYYASTASSGIGTSYMTATLGTVPPDIGPLYPTLYFQSTVNGNTVNIIDDGSGYYLTYLNGIVWG